MPWIGKIKLMKLVMPQEAPLSGDLVQFFAGEEKGKPGIWTATLKRKYAPVA